MLKKFSRSAFVQNILGALGAAYLGLVRATSRFTSDPADPASTLDLPIIAAMWHGQHFMIHFAWGREMPVAALISRHGDGEINAHILRRIGVTPIRGAGGPPQKMHEKGGVAALRAMLRALQQGMSIAMTADVPKRARVAGPGIIVLAQRSGRPIYPVAVVLSRRIDLNSWDRASIGLPFSRGAIVLGRPIHVGPDINANEAEALRLEVEAGLDDVHRRAYAAIGAIDPGARLSRSAVDGATAAARPSGAKP